MKENAVSTDLGQDLFDVQDGSEEFRLPDELELELTVRDRDTIAALCEHEDLEAREQYALSALRIGVLALRHARGQVDADLVRREGQRLLADLQGHLGRHSQTVQDRLTHSLRDYFDPENGHFQQRIRNLIKRDGELEELLRRQITGDDSELARKLIQHVGKDSPLFKLLDPNESRGLIGALRTTVDDQLRQQRERVLSEFSLDNKEGALCRFLAELTESHDQLREGLRQKIDGVVKEFSLDEENSALSRLVRNVDRAQRTISSEFSLDNEASALSRLRQMLDETRREIRGNLTLDDESSPLACLKRELLELVRQHQKSSHEFQEEVKVALASMTAKREEAAKGTRHGLEFEDAACEFIHRLCEAQGHFFTPTGSTVGLRERCKVGDGVVEIGPEYADAGARIVMEAKEKREYTLPKAKEEIELARKNRDAGVGLFVFSAKTAPETMGPLNRYGNDVYVIWDAEDPETDVYLQAGFSIASALCRKGTDLGAAQHDFEAVQRAILEIEKQTEDLEKVVKLSQSIQRNGEDIATHVERTRKTLRKRIVELRDHTGAMLQKNGSE
jgi:hypothetical protein